MKEFVIKSSRSVGIMAILGFVLFVGLVLSVDEAMFETILPGSSGAIILLIIALGTVWGLVGMFLSRKPREAYSPEQLKAQHSWLAIVFVMGRYLDLTAWLFDPRHYPDNWCCCRMVQ